MHKGSCLCGVVSSVYGHLKDPDACHCNICRKWSGHYLVSTDIPREELIIEGKENVSRFQSSEKVRRGFCKTCGTNFFLTPSFKQTGQPFPWGSLTGQRM